MIPAMEIIRSLIEESWKNIPKLMIANNQIGKNIVAKESQGYL